MIVREMIEKLMKMDMNAEVPGRHWLAVGANFIPDADGGIIEFDHVRLTATGYGDAEEQAMKALNCDHGTGWNYLILPVWPAVIEEDDQ